jgi:hypothetical protein
MSDKKQASPAVVAAMVVGIVAAGGYIAMSLTGSGAPEPVKTLPATGAPAVGTTTTAGTPTPGTGNAGMSATAPGTVVASAPGGEASLAPSADPFVAIPGPPAQRQTAPVAPTVQAAPQNSGRSGPLISGGTVQPLPPFQAPGTTGPMVVTKVEAEVPDLVGTMLGDRPTAVFRSDKELRSVPVGGRFHGWKVVSVRHGEVIVKNGTRTETLGVGSGHAGSIALHWDESSPNQGQSAAPRSEFAAQKPADEPRSNVQTAALSEPNSITQDLTGPNGPEARATTPAAPTTNDAPVANGTPPAGTTPTGDAPVKPAPMDPAAPIAPAPAPPVVTTVSDPPVRKP